MESLRADNRRLTAEVERLSAELAMHGKGSAAATGGSTGAQAWGGTSELTLQSLAQMIDANQRKLEERMAKLQGETRAPPAQSIGLAATIGSMEDHGMTVDQVQEAHEIFELYDEDCSGSIDAVELLDILRMLGQDPTQDDVDKLVKEVDENENGDLDLNEFLTVYSMIVANSEVAAGSDGIQLNARRRISRLSFYGVGALMRWVHQDGGKVGGDITGPSIPTHRRFPRQLVLRRDVEFLFYMCIVLSAANSGLQTYDEYEHSDPVVMLGHFTNVMFAFEVLLKMAAESSSIMGYFSDLWNSFDVFVLISLLILTPITSSGTGVGAIRVLRILRLLRALRILRAAKVLPQLTLVLETLIRSASSVVYILGFMLLVAYIFAIVAVTTFGKNDPFYFGDLGVAMTTLFRVATLEGWTPIMYIQIYGCKGIGRGLVTYQEMTTVEILDCSDEASPYLGRAFFIVYVMVASFFMLNLFIGVICNSMTEMQREAEEKVSDAKAWAVATRLKAHKDEDGKLSPRHERQPEKKKDRGTFKKKERDSGSQKGTNGKMQVEVDFDNPIVEGAESPHLAVSSDDLMLRSSDESDLIQSK